MQDHSLSIRVLAGALVFMALMVGGYALPMAAGATGADQPSSGATANRRAAVEDATSLLGRLQLPPGATNYSAQPAGANAPLADPPIRSGSPNLIDLPTWWLVPGQPQQVLSWIETHEPEGSVHKVSGESHFGAVTESWFAAFEWPNIKEVLGTRWLTVQVVAAAGESTALRADAQVVWIVPHFASERLPTSARIIDIKVEPPGGRPPKSVVVSKVDAVLKIAALINRLPAVQPTGPVYGCGPYWERNQSTYRLTFRANSGGPVLAKAIQSKPIGVCSTMTLMIRGHRQTPLAGASPVIDEVEGLLKAGR